MKRNLLKYIFTLIIVIITGCSPLSLDPKSIKPIQKLSYATQRDIAVVLGAGGARGFAHIGVLEELVKAGIEPDIIVGCSAGSIVGSMYADDPNPLRLKDKLLYRKRGEFIQLSLINSIGLVNEYTFKDFLEKQLSTDDFKKLKKHFVAVTTNLSTGELTPIDSGSLTDAIIASSSVPGILKPKKIQGQYFVDGAIADPLPVRVARSLRAKFIIAVDISPQSSKTMPSNLFGVMARSLEISYQKSSQSHHHLADAVIDVKLEPFSMFSDNKNIETYKKGKGICSQENSSNT